MSLRRIEADDLAMVLSWRNHPEVRKYMFSSHEISWEEHKAWFERERTDPAIECFLYTERDRPLGVVTFCPLHREQGNCFWGFYKHPGAPRGIGLKMEYAALEYAFGELGLHKVNSEVIAFNEAVIRMQRKVGFREEGRFRDFFYDGSAYHDVVRFGMLEREWV